MLNKEFFMVRRGSLDPVLSISISPDVRRVPAIFGMLSSGESFNVNNVGETTFKLSELDLTAIITINYDDGTLLSTLNLTSAFRGGAVRAPEALTGYYRIMDRTQPASILLM